MIIGVISDIHIGSDHDKEVLATSIKNINHCGAEGLLMAGDIGDYHQHRKDSFDIFLEQFPKKYHQNLLLMLGNHDVRTGAEPHEPLDPDLVGLYDSYLEKCNIDRQEDTMCIDAWIDGYHFICLNTDVPLKNQMELNEASLLWLEKKLAEGVDANKPIFVMTHQAFNCSHWRSYLYGGFGPQDERLKSLFSRYPQIIMLSGHIHNGFGIIEAIQRPLGTLIDIPSLTLGENGVTDKGTGYLLKIEGDKLTFEAWNFYQNIYLSEYDTVILLPTLSSLAAELPDYADEETDSLISESNRLMNKEYKDEYIKIYDEKTWEEINTLRNKIIKYKSKPKSNEINYHKLKFNNDDNITIKVLNAALNQHNHILIESKNGHWADQITIPPLKNNQSITIDPTAAYCSTLIVNKEKHRISTGEKCTVSCKSYWQFEMKNDVDSLEQKSAYQLTFKNEDSITQKMIKDIFKTNDSIYIEIKNEKWLNKISIPKLPLSNKKIIVKSTADRNSSIVAGYYTYIIKSGDLLTISAKQNWSIDKKKLK